MGYSDISNLNKIMCSVNGVSWSDESNINDM